MVKIFREVFGVKDFFRFTHGIDFSIFKDGDGERQKVMIAKALAQETPVIFLGTN